MIRAPSATVLTCVAQLCLAGCGADGQSVADPEALASAGGDSAAPGAGGVPLDASAGGAAPGPGGSSAGGAAAPGGGPAAGGAWSLGGAGAGGASGTGGGTPGTGGGGAGTGGAATGGASGECARSAVQPHQLVFIGDSFIAAPTSEIAPSLQALFQAEGVAAYSPMPRYYQLIGTNMDQIAAQYDRAHLENPDIEVVIGNGGGNNVLINDRSCLTQAPPTNAGCEKTVRDALAVADALMGKMEAHGVSHFVYFFYPHEPTEGLYQGTAPAINATLDYTEPLAREVCDRHPICTFVSLREASGDAIGSGYTERGHINPNDVHPSPAGSRFFAQAIWNVMKENCILHP